MDLIKEAFLRIKQDIFSLQEQIYYLKQEIELLKQSQYPQNQDFIPTTPTQNQVLEQAQTDTPTHIPTHSHTNLNISTGNEGVPTDRQTNQQTDNYTEKFAQAKKQDTINEFQQAQEILDSLDNIKKGIRLKFKRLTPQEMLIFSTLYTFEEQNIKQITYKLIANNLNLSESSIRDYTNKLTNKGIPIIKTRQNNKKITLSISQDLKDIASLSTINKLRDI
jgi:predicted transcriptional regulator